VAETEQILLRINGKEHAVRSSADVPLLYVLRNELGLTAAKFGCGLEQCHACAVLVDGESVPTCVEPVASFAGKEITTLEAIGRAGALHRVQQAFLEEQAGQCGYCIPGFVISGVALLERTPSPSEAEIVAALEPHLCRCGSYPRILRAMRRAAS
jgi:nicotinate dehydrogenase subunit A